LKTGEKTNNESGQNKSAEIVWHQVVPLWTVDTCGVSKITETVMRKNIKSFDWRPKG